MKYSLFPTPLMQEGSFCYTSTVYQHPYKDEWIVGTVFWELYENYIKNWNDEVILGIEKKDKEDIYVLEFQKHINSLDEDELIETPDVYYEKNYYGSYRVLSNHLAEYCIIKDKNITRFVKIVDRTPTEIHYQHLKPAKDIGKIDIHYLDELNSQANSGEIAIIHRNEKFIYYVKYIPTGKIYKAPYKQYYANMINEILKYDEKAKQKIK